MTFNILKIFGKERASKPKYTAEEYLTNWLAVKGVIEQNEEVKQNIRESFHLAYESDSKTNSKLYLSNGSNHILYRIGKVQLPDREVHLATRLQKNSLDTEQKTSKFLSEITDFTKVYTKRSQGSTINVAYIFGLVEHNNIIGYLTEDLTENNKYKIKESGKRFIERNGETFFVDPINKFDQGYNIKSQQYLEHILRV